MDELLTEAGDPILTESGEPLLVESAGGGGEAPSVTWLASDIGRFVTGESQQFQGSVLQRWRDEAEAAVLAGQPYPHVAPDLKRRMLDYFIAQA